MESDVYKISNSKRHSSIFYGPITAVYGIGIIAILLLKKYILDKIHCNKILKIFITYILCVITLSLVEFICGNIIYLLFNINMWDYSNKSIHFGKYLCLELSLIWGLFGVLYLYILKKYTDKIVKIIPKNATILFCIFLLIDTILIFINK